jgi:hypothetical protein
MQQKTLSVICQIDQHIKSLEYLEAKNLLLQHFHELKKNHRRELPEMCLRLDLYEQAFNLLKKDDFNLALIHGKENILRKAHELALIAYHFQFYGAYHLAENFYLHIEQSLSDDLKKELYTKAPPLLRQRIYCYLAQYDYSKAEKTLLQQASLLHDPQKASQKLSWNESLYQLLKAHILAGQKKYQQAMQQVSFAMEEAEHPLADMLKNYTLSLVALLNDDGEKAYSFAQAATKNSFEKSHIKRDMAAIIRQYALAFLSSTHLYDQSARNHVWGLLSHSYQAQITSSAQPSVCIAFFFILQQFPEKYTLLPSVKNALLFHPIGSPYSSMLGHPFQSKVVFSYPTKKLLSPNEDDVFLWESPFTLIKPFSYKSDALHPTFYVIDLKAELYLRPGKAPRKINVEQAQLIRALMGAGPFPLSQWFLMDLLYQTPTERIVADQERLRKILPTLQELGLRVVKEQRMVQLLGVEEHHVVIIPSFSEATGNYFFMKRKQQMFSRKDVEETFQCNDDKALRLIQEWRSAGVIHNLEEFKYEFVSSPIYSRS